MAASRPDPEAAVLGADPREGGGRRVIFMSGDDARAKAEFGLILEKTVIPALKAMAPTQTEPPFLLTKLVALAFFVALGIVTTIKFRVAHA